MAKTRALGSSGLNTPALVFGCNVLGWSVEGDTAFDILDRFVEAGGTLLDTADIYAPGNAGSSETLIGEWLKRRRKRYDVLIATKVGMLPGEGGQGLAPSRIAAAVEASLKKLGTDYIDLYFAHKDDPDVPQEAVAEAFDTLVKDGKVRALGASNFTADRLASALEVADKGGFTPYTVLQPELNLMERSSFEGALQDLCVAKNIGVIPYFALASGFLTGKYRAADDAKGATRERLVDKYLNPRGDAVLAAMDAVSAETGASLAQIALAWNAAQPGVTAPIASATSVKQLDELMPAMSLELSADQLSRLDAASRS